MSEMLSAKSPRSRMALIQMLQSQQNMGPAYGGAAEGAARAGSQIINALIAKQLMGQEDKQDFVKQASARALNNGMEQVSGVDKINMGRTPEGGIDIEAPTTTENIRPAGPAMDPATQQQFMSRALDPEQVLMMRLQQQQQANAPFNLGPNERRFAGGKEIAANIVPQKPDTFKVGQTREFQRGGAKVTQEFDGKTWNDIAEGPAFAPREGQSAPTGYRFKPDGSLEAIPGGPATKPDSATAPSGYRYGADGKSLEAIPGGPADIGQKGLPQSYKMAKTGLKTLKSSVKAFRDMFAGTPEVRDPNTGKVIKPATKGTGTEIKGKDAGTLDTMHTEILLGLKQAMQLGTLDKGAMEVAERFLRRPTGPMSVFQDNDYTTAQVDQFISYLDRAAADLDDSFQKGTWKPPGEEGVPEGVDPADWAYMTPEQKKFFTNG